MKIINHFIFIMFPFLLGAQDNPLYLKPPSGKARIVVLYDMYERWQRTIVLEKAPLFINGELKCRLNDGTYTYFDIAPGTYTLIADVSGKKLRKKLPVTELEAEEGMIYYFEMEGLFQGIIKMVVQVQKRKPRELEEIIERKRTRFRELCNEE